MLSEGTSREGFSRSRVACFPAKFSSFFLGFGVLFGTGRSSVANTGSVTAGSVTSTGILRIKTLEKVVAFSLSRYRDIVVKADGGRVCVTSAKGVYAEIWSWDPCSSLSHEGVFFIHLVH